MWPRAGGDQWRRGFNPQTNEPSCPSWFGPKITDWNGCTDIHHFYRPCGLIEATAPLTICIDPLWTFWNVSIQLHFILSALCWSSSLNYGNTKGQAFGLFVPNGCIWGPVAQPAHSCSVTVSAVWSDVTLRRHYPHHCASLPLCTGNQLWQPWPSNLIGPVTPWPAAIEMVLTSTTITCRPPDYCNNTLTWTQRLSASVPLSVFAPCFLSLPDLKWIAVI